MQVRFVFFGVICAATASIAPAQTGRNGEQAPSETSASLYDTETSHRIVVTAQKRPEDASRIPISLSVIDNSDLSDRQIADLPDLTRAIPNISFSAASGAGPGLSNIEIRGISSSAGSGTVGIYLDDVSMTTRNLYSLGNPEPKFFDLERVELLRGPQAALYGASSMGGTIRFISNQPDASKRTNLLYGEMSSTAHGGTSYRTSGIFNLPLVPEELGLRIGLGKGHVGGYIDQVSADTGKTQNTGINSQDESIAKIAIKWSPMKGLSITPSFFYQEVQSRDIDATHLDLAPYQTAKLVREPGTDRLQVPSVTINADLGFADMTSVTSYYQRDFNRVQDGTTVNSGLLGSIINTLPDAPYGLGATVSKLPSSVFLNSEIRQFAQEIRLASRPAAAGGSPWGWLGGLYFANLRTTVTDNEPIHGINAASAAAGTSLDNLLGFAFPKDNSYSNIRRTQTRQTSLFGQLDYALTPSLRASAGLRYLQAHDSLQRDGDLFFANGPAHSFADAEFHAVTPTFGMTWNRDARSTLYASIGKGFRLGGENSDVPYNVCAADFKALNLAGAPSSFAPDQLWSYELGGKFRFMGGRLSVNAAAFYIDWTALQQAVFLPSCGYGFETNVGTAKSYGAELEIKGNLSSDVSLGITGGYTRAVLTSDEPMLGASSGDPIQGVPKFNASANAEYRFGFFHGNGFARASVYWVGSSYGSLVKSDPDYRRPSYSTIDASIGTAWGQWEWSLFVKNILDSDKVIQRPAIQFLNEGYRLRPRTIGLTLTGRL